MKRQLERLIDGSPALYVVVDEQGEFLELRGAWQSLLGWDPAELIGKRFEIIVHPDDLEATLRAYAEGYRRPRASAQLEVRCRHADGSYRWISWTSPPTTAGLGVAFGLDVTERRQQLAELMQTRSKLQSVFDTVPFYLTYTDPDGVIVFINRTYPGVTQEQVVGSHILNWLPPDARDSMQQAYDRALAGEAGVEIVVQGSGSDGPAWYRSRLGAVRQDDQIVGVVIVGEDITELRRAEERARRAARLEGIGQVAGSIAHDFGNLLMAMSSLLEVLRLESPSLPESVHELVDQLDQAVMGARAMTRDIVKAVHQGGGTDAQLDLVAGVRVLQGILRATVGRGMQLLIECRASEAVVALAPHELQQLLINLVVNSREATRGAGSVEIRIEIADVTAEDGYWPPPGRYARLSVVDDGPGIAPQIRQRVIEPFFTTKVQGGGFGLSTSYNLVRGRGGDLQIKERPGGGSVILIYLPLLQKGSAVGELPAAREAGGQSSRTVLLADDDDLLRTNVARYLSRHGHLVLEARDGADALEVYGRHPGQIDVVVSDLNMPGRDGLWLFQALRERDPKLPLIAMSGTQDPEQQRELTALGARWLLKPSTPSELLQALASATAS